MTQISVGFFVEIILLKVTQQIKKSKPSYANQGMKPNQNYLAGDLYVLPKKEKNM